jgi:hypothetical protein
MTTFLFYAFILVLLGILVRIFWKPLLVLGSTLAILAGIAVSSAITAVCFQFFTLMTSELSDWGSFSMYFKYCFVFFTVAIVVYGCIVYDLVNIGVRFVHKLFTK